MFSNKLPIPMKYLNKIVLSFGLLLISYLGANNSCVAQDIGQAIFCGYDQAGNRILRRVLIMGDGKLADTTATEEPEEPPLQDGDILAYPNPTRGEVTIGISPNLLEETTAHFMLVDLSGREIRKGPIVQSQTGLDLTGEANGNYILRVTPLNRRP